MKDTLLQSLKASVPNDNLVGLGEIDIDYISGTLAILALPNTTVTMLRNGSETTAESINVSDNVAGEINIFDKYNLKSISADNADIAIESFSFCTMLEQLRLNAKGNLSELENVGTLNRLQILKSNFAEFMIPYLPALQALEIPCEHISLAELSAEKLPLIKRLTFKTGIIEGNWSDIASLENLKFISMTSCNNQSSHVSGSFSSISEIESLLEIVGISNGDSQMTYESSSLLSSDRNIVCVRNMKMDTESIDNYLINMANCQVGTGYQSKSISIIGYRTSASDEAIVTLQSKGFSVIVVH